MKKTLTLLLAVMLTSALFQANAKGSFLIKGGLTFQNMKSVSELTSLGIKGATRWEAGLGFQTGTLAGFSLQPEILYKAKGLKFGDDTNVTVNYLEVPVNIQWGVDLLIARPFIFASPYVGFKLKQSYSQVSLLPIDFDAAVNKVCGGFGLGLGIDISHFQITAKYDWDFGGVANWNEYVSEVKAIKKSDGMFELAVAIKF